LYNLSRVEGLIEYVDTVCGFLAVDSFPF
jgi:hypothetical protein